MASARFLEEALSTDVDESAVNAIVGSLENQLVTSTPAASSHDNSNAVHQNHLGSVTSSANLIGVSKYSVANNIHNISGELKIVNSNFQNINNAIGNIQGASNDASSIVSIANLTNVPKGNEQLKVIYSQNSQGVSSPIGNRLTFPAQSMQNGNIISSPLTQTILHSTPQTVNKSINMQSPLVIKQGNSSGQVGMQPTLVSVPMSVSSSLSNVMTLTKPSNQSVVATSQNMAGGPQPTIIPNVQIVNMRPGAPGVSAQKSVAAVSPRVVIGTPHVIGSRASAPGITLQTLPSLQPGHQGHLLLKTENGQYQLLRVGPAPAPNSLAAPQQQTIRLSAVPAVSRHSTPMPARPLLRKTIFQHPGVSTVSTSVAQSAPSLQPQLVSAPAPVAVAAPAPQPAPQPPIVTTQKPSDNTKEKCRNFLANLLDLSSKEPKSVERNVRNLIQELIDAQVEPEQFCDRLERLLNASPQPCLIGFLKKSLPLLRQSLVTKELIIEGIQPPSTHVAFSLPGPMQPIATSNLQMQKPLLTKPATQPGAKPNTIAVLQNIPVQTQKLNVNKAGSPKVHNSSLILNSKTNFSRASTMIAASAPSKTILREKEKKPMPYSQPFSDIDKMAGDDDINDVAAMGGVNLAEETQRILGSTELIGTQIRSCKDEYLVPLHVMQGRLKAAAARHGLEEPPGDVAALASHAVYERLKSLVEKLAVIAEHRIDIIKTDPRYEVMQDVKSQMKFLEELDRVDRKRREDSEREMLLRAAKSRSKNEDPEQAKLKAKAKEMQRAEMEELRQREANLTALQAIGPRKKARTEGGAGDAGALNGSRDTSQSSNGRSQAALRSRLKRVNYRDLVFLLEQERELAHSPVLYRCYFK